MQRIRNAVPYFPCLLPSASFSETLRIICLQSSKISSSQVSLILNVVQDTENVSRMRVTIYTEVEPPGIHSPFLLAARLILISF